MHWTQSWTVELKDGHYWRTVCLLYASQSSFGGIKKIYMHLEVKEDMFDKSNMRN